jgi:hypothetical protein
VLANSLLAAGALSAAACGFVVARCVLTTRAGMEEQKVTPMR